MYAFMRHVTKHTARSEVHSICCGVTLATHCNTLQHTATHCNTLQHTATHCNTLQHTATHETTQHLFFHGMLLTTDIHVFHVCGVTLELCVL